MLLFKWLPGRQPGVKYKKLCFLSFKIGRYGFDGYILKYPLLMVLPEHTDPINGKMWRFNLTLRGRCVGYYRKPNGLVIYERVAFFRPDIYPHTVRTLTKTYKLSLGFAKFNKI